MCFEHFLNGFIFDRRNSGTHFLVRDIRTDRFESVDQTILLKHLSSIHRFDAEFTGSSILVVFIIVIRPFIWHAQ